MDDFEKLGMFYLGKSVDPSSGKLEEPLWYASKNFTTHAVCVGMTGSGKTGLGIGILEEAAIDRIPAIVIDPKGDLGNLLLTFPDLSPSEFKPWINESDAENRGMSSEEYAEFTAKTWKEGLAAWGEGPERIKKFRDSVELEIYTPASDAGIPLSILRSFSAPSKEQMLDTSGIREKILSLTSSLLGLLGIDADPIKSRDHILVSTIIEQAWQNGVDLDIPALIRQVQKPPFTKIGALDIDTFYPEKERIALSINLNNLLASPGFRAWMEGNPLDIGQLLHTREGKPKLSIISIAHLSDSERMFFVTLFLNEVISWMRRLEGTSTLRALLYMDEIFGFFPPTAMPPSKLPMLTLLKQARAFGLGIVLATQNPVDLDYKGLANCGTWFIGKLQTDRDKIRVLEGLKMTSNGEFNTDTLDKMLALTGNRTFIMRSVYEKDPVLFQTRWTLSYLRGPLTLVQIARLTRESKERLKSEPILSVSGGSSGGKPDIMPGIAEFFMHPPESKEGVRYEPEVAGLARIRFVDSKYKIDTWREINSICPSDEEGKHVRWESGTNIPDLKNLLRKEPLSGSSYGELPAGLMQEKNYSVFAKEFSAWLYQNETLQIYLTYDPNLFSDADETEESFRQRVAFVKQQKQVDSVKKLNEKYAGKMAGLEDKIRRAQERTTEKQQNAGRRKLQTFISFGSTILGAILGRGVTKGTISRAGTSFEKATRINKDSEEVASAEKETVAYQEELKNLQALKNEEMLTLSAGEAPENIKIEAISIRPRKGDISVEQIALVWRS